jgi:hypothetical protein
MMDGPESSSGRRSANERTSYSAVDEVLPEIKRRSANPAAALSMGYAHALTIELTHRPLINRS